MPLGNHPRGRGGHASEVGKPFSCQDVTWSSFTESTVLQLSFGLLSLVLYTSRSLSLWILGLSPLWIIKQLRATFPNSADRDTTWAAGLRRNVMLTRAHPIEKDQMLQACYRTSNNLTWTSQQPCKWGQGAMCWEGELGFKACSSTSCLHWGRLFGILTLVPFCAMERTATALTFQDCSEEIHERAQGSA